MKVSIITIVYNNQDCIQSCIESVLSQSYSNIEHIVIDGGSSDGTQAVIEPYLSKLGYYCSEKDSGLYNALNKGIKNATGDVIGILHSDDFYYDSNVIQNVADSFKESAADLVYGNGMYVTKKDTTTVKRIYKAKPYKKRYLAFGWIPLHTTIYVKKSVFESYGYYREDYAIASDYDISLRWFTNTNIKKVFLNKWLVKMRLGGKSTTAALQKRKSTEDFKIMKEFKFWSYVTLVFKIARKIPQYALPKFIKYS
jgi:glycosyltransferase involved in cell wall biosynthesis